MRPTRRLRRSWGEADRQLSVSRPFRAEPVPTAMPASEDPSAAHGQVPGGLEAPTIRADHQNMTRTRRRHYGRWLLAVIALYLLAALAKSLWSNRTVNRHIIAEYIFDPRILHGIAVTLELTGVCLVLGIFGGVMLAVMRQSRNPVLSTMAVGYIQLFRAMPPLVQLLFWGFLGALFPRLYLGLPLTGIRVWSAPTNTILTPFIAAIIALTLVMAAYTAEVFRSGIIAVDPGQSEAALALGLTDTQAMFQVTLPQAIRVIIPALGNQTILLLKATALVSVIGGSELLTSTERIYAQNFQEIPLLMVAGAWYLVLISALAIIQRYLEHHFSPQGKGGKGDHGKQMPSLQLDL